MQLISKDQVTGNQPLVATIGFFDGVHLGHRFLIEQVKQEAAQRGLSSAIITFPVHPRKVLQQDYQPALLCGYDEKISRLASTGIDYCIPIQFSKAMSEYTAQQFMYNYLQKEFAVNTLVIGYDHRFGNNREASFDDYEQYGREIGMAVVQAKEWDKHRNVSSSHVRQLLATGDVSEAADLLSYNYTISGTIVEGFKVGRTIGFPTANIAVWETYKVIPALGVYAVYVHVDGEKHRGMLYIGTRPTLQNGENISVEVNLFAFDRDLYHKSLTVEFLDFVRADEKFSDIETLKRQIQKDKDTVIALIDAYENE